MRLSPTMRVALERGEPDKWLGTAECRVRGTTMEALQQRGLAEVSTAGRERQSSAGWLLIPTGASARFVYRLTEAGVKEKARLAGRKARRATSGNR